MILHKADFYFHFTREKKKKISISEKIWGRRMVEEGENENDLEREVQDLTKM